MNARKIGLAGALILCLAGVLWVLPPGLLTLETLKREHSLLADWQRLSPFLSASLYFLLYTVVAALSIPGAALLTLLGGALFGLFGTAQRRQCPIHAALLVKDAF